MILRPIAMTGILALNILLGSALVMLGVAWLKQLRHIAELEGQVRDLDRTVALLRFTVQRELDADIDDDTQRGPPHAPPPPRRSRQTEFRMTPAANGQPA